MADDDWESREDFDEIIIKPPPRVSDKWAGEDEDLDVKDNWDEDQGAGKVRGSVPEGEGTERATQREKKKKPGNNLKTTKPDEELTPEELAAQKIKDQKTREDHEIQIVKESFGSSAISDSDPVTKDDFDALRRRIMDELLPFEKRPPYQDFVEDLIQDLAIVLPSKRLKKVKTTVEALYFEKTKAEKIAKGPPSKGNQKIKVKLHVEGDHAMLKGDVDADLDDYEDFM